MKKVYKILERDSGDLVYMVSDGDNVIAWFGEREHAKEFANIRNGNLTVSKVKSIMAHESVETTE